MPGVLGFDLAKTTGVAWIGDAAPGEPRPWELGLIEINPKGAVRGQHYFQFQKRLDEQLRDWKPELVVFEQIEFVGKGMAAYRMNAILCGLVMVRCEAFGIRYEGVGVSAIKAFAGHGHATKERMATFAKRKLFGTRRLRGPFPADATHDQVDALWTAWYGVEHHLLRLRRAS